MDTGAAVDIAAMLLPVSNRIFIYFGLHMQESGDIVLHGIFSGPEGLLSSMCHWVGGNCKSIFKPAHLRY